MAARWHSCGVRTLCGRTARGLKPAHGLCSAPACCPARSPPRWPWRCSPPAAATSRPRTATPGPRPPRRRDRVPRRRAGTRWTRSASRSPRRTRPRTAAAAPGWCASRASRPTRSAPRPTASRWSTRRGRSASRPAAASTSRSRPSGTGARPRSRTRKAAATPRCAPATRRSQLEAETLDQQLLGIEVTGRPLVQGDRITLVYGAGLAGAMPDRYAERGSPFWFAVDGDGDGTRKVLEDSPTIDVRPGPPAGLLLYVPTVVRPGETLPRHARLRRRLAQHRRRRPRARSSSSTCRRASSCRRRCASSAQHAGRRTRRRRRDEARRLSAARARDGRRGREQPDGGRAPRARASSGATCTATRTSPTARACPRTTSSTRATSRRSTSSALTDHDHWGMLPLYSHPELWRGDREADAALPRAGPLRHAARLRVDELDLRPPPRALLRGPGPRLPVERPALRVADSSSGARSEGRRALTFAHHSAGGPIAMDWEHPARPALRAGHRDRVDPRLERGAGQPQPDRAPGRGQLRARRARPRLPARLHRQRRPPRRPPRRLRRPTRRWAGSPPSWPTS